MSRLPPEPSPTLLRRTSVGSRIRQFVGYRPDWLKRRTASTPSANCAKRTAVEARYTGRSCSRIQASVMTPRMPSDPMNIRSGLGPAPEPGSRRDATMPLGVTTRSDSTISSMCVYSVAKCPPERVAIQPPRVENSNDCG